MGTRGYIFFVSIFLTSCFSQSQNNAQKQGLNSKYYCEEFSVTPPTDRNWREAVMTELSAEKYPNFFDAAANPDVVKFCPNFQRLSEHEKKVIWMRIIDGMIFFESTCKPNASAKGPNGTAYGLLQLHLGREQDYERNCKKYDSKSGVRSIACGLSMIHEQIVETRKLFFSGSYWEVLRPSGRSKRAKSIVNHIWYYPLCQGKRLASTNTQVAAPSKL